MSGKWQDRLRRDWREALLVMILAGATIPQLAWIGRHSMRLLVAKVWENRHLDATSRSADAAYGYDYMQWINFVRTVVPEDGNVFVIFSPALPQFTIGAFLEYFLIPRHVSTCPTNDLPDCVDQAAGPESYFLYTGGAGMAMDGYRGFRVIAFDDSLGVLVPEQGSGD